MTAKNAPFCPVHLFSSSFCFVLVLCSRPCWVLLGSFFELIRSFNLSGLLTPVPWGLGQCLICTECPVNIWGITTFFFYFKRQVWKNILHNIIWWMCLLVSLFYFILSWYNFVLQVLFEIMKTAFFFGLHSNFLKTDTLSYCWSWYSEEEKSLQAYQSLTIGTRKHFSMLQCLALLLTWLHFLRWLLV